MKKYALWIAIAICVPQGPAFSIHYEQLNAVKLLRGEKRFEEAIQKLDSMAGKAADADENFHYLNLAVEIAVSSLKDAERALALAQKITDPGTLASACWRTSSATTKPWNRCAARTSTNGMSAVVVARI